MKKKVTLGMLIDLIDYNREGDRIIDIMDNNGETEASLRTDSDLLPEERLVNSIDADSNRLQIWLEDEGDEV